MASFHGTPSAANKKSPFAALEARNRSSASVGKLTSENIILDNHKKSQQMGKSQTLGEKRIIAELSDRPVEAKRAAEQYRDLVDSTVAILRDEFNVQSEADAIKDGNIKNQLKNEERFITEIWGIMNSNLGIIYGENRFGLLHEALSTKQWDCDNSAFLVFDAASMLGINSRITVVTGHAFIVTDNFFFETTTGLMAPIQELGNKYPRLEFSSYDHDKLMAISHNHISDQHILSKKYSRALAELNKSIELNPEYADSYRKRGFVLRMLGKNYESLEDLQKSVKLNPGLADTYFQLGNTFLEIGNIPMAIENYKKSAEMSPDFKTYTCLGYACQFKGDFQSAVRELGKALEFKPHDAGTLNNRGHAYARLGNHRKAIEDYTQALKVQPNLVEAYSNRSESYIAIGEKKKAEEDRKMAEKIAAQNL